MGTDLPSANFMPGVVNERQAIKALEGQPMRSYITWQSSTPAFPHGVIITYSNTVKRDVKTHQRLARSDLGVWMPLSQSEHRVFPTVRHLLATRKYIDGSFRMPSAKEDVPPVPAPVLRNTLRFICGNTARRGVTIVSALLVAAAALCLTNLLTGIDRSGLAMAADVARTVVKREAGQAVETLRNDLLPVMTAMDDMAAAELESNAPAVIPPNLEIDCFVAVAKVHASLTEVAAQQRRHFPEAAFSASVGALAVLAAALSVVVCTLLCVGVPGTGFPADKGLQMGLSGLDSPVPDNAPSHPVPEAADAASSGAAGMRQRKPAGSSSSSSSSSSSKRGRAPSDSLAGLSADSRVTADPRAAKRAASRVQGWWRFLWLLVLGTGLVEAIGAGYIAVRVAFATGGAPAALARAATPMRPNWFVSEAFISAAGGSPASAAGAEDSRPSGDDRDFLGEALEQSGIDGIKASVFHGEIPPRCAAAMEQSHATWMTGVVDVGRVHLASVSGNALSALSASFTFPPRPVPFEVMIHGEPVPVIRPGDDQPTASATPVACPLLWPASVLVDSPTHPAAIAHNELAARLQTEDERLRALQPSWDGPKLGEASGVRSAVAAYRCRDFIVQSDVAVSRSTILFMAAAIVIFVTLQLSREAAIDAAGLGLRWRLKDLGLGLGVRLDDDLAVDLDEDETLATKQKKHS
ncbi:hypothetical protein FNF27_05336 [Cafeteria roenbergensis]|uniref:Uncharacterized protein n=1 Tax=Cafeteria roenbergensis TaxID=33653 RepID=A0A5A8E7G3_CAFRO|nr:hypothetical protein FNF27_05336 [Cafeteria roenbergensis]